MNGYKKMTPEAKASLWFLVCNILQKGLAFMVIPIYTRLLTTAEYGSFSVYNAWYQLFLAFATLSMSSDYFVIGTLKNEIEIKKMLGILQGCCSVVCVAFFCIVLIFFKPLSNLFGFNLMTLEIMFTQIFFTSPILFLTRKQQYEFKYRLIVFITITMSILTILVSLFMIKVWPDKNYSLILGAAMVQTAFGIAIYLYNFIEAKAFCDFSIWKEAICFCVPLLPHNLAYFVLNSADRVMIDRMCTTSDAGVYSLASNISLAIGVITNAVGVTLNPWLLKKIKEKKNYIISRMMNRIAVALGLFVVFASLISPEVLKVVASDDYQEAKWIMPPIMLGAYFLFLAGAPCLVSLYYERKRTVALASNAAAALNIGLNWLLIPLYGYKAAAYTTLVSYMGFAIFHFYMAKKISVRSNQEHALFNNGFLWGVALFITVICMALMGLYRYLGIRYILVLLGVTVLIKNKDQIAKIYSDLEKDK